MKVKIVADSSSNLLTLNGADFTSAPLTIVAGEREFVDDTSLDLPAMLEYLRGYKGKSGTACPSVGAWVKAFDDADIVYGVSITSNLSGAYNAASVAAEQYMEANPGKKVFILDSLSTGPEMELILEKYAELINQGLGFEEVCEAIKAYSANTHLYFSLESLSNLAKNGRVSHTVAAAVGLLGIRVVGKASDVGTLESLHKCRGEKRAIRQLLVCMAECGYKGGKVRITHSYNENAANALAAMIKEGFPDSDITIALNGGLCCFYSEEGGLLVGFES